VNRDRYGHFPHPRSYLIRILDPDTNNMEMLTYLDQMTAARERTR